jgi:acyl-coenzyme A synthetase/AMP-(fatty) acid ligase
VRAARRRCGRQLLERVCDAVAITYSMQECGSIARVVERDAASVTETVGRPHPGVELEIVNERGEPVPEGESGEIRVRVPGMASGYVDDPAASAAHFRDGWFQPGDLVSLTAEGALVVHGRADDVMNLNGIKIAPAEIERALERHPAVKGRSSRFRCARACTARSRSRRSSSSTARARTKASSSASCASRWECVHRGA